MMMVSNRKPNPNPSPTNQAGQKQLKQHMCIVFGYCGTNYYGLQSQQAEGDPEHPTVSDVLRQAFLKSGAIAPSNFVPLHRTKWRIASRTDKGVHAALAAVSFKMETWPEQLEDPKALTPPTHHSSGGGAARAIAGASGGAGGGDGGAGGGGGVQAVASSLVKPTEVQLSQAEIARINGYLPNDVRLLGAARVRGAFEPRECASSRSYEYLLPAWALGSLSLREFDDILRTFEGTKRYHNFCSGLRRYSGDWHSASNPSLSWPLALPDAKPPPASFRSVLRCAVQRRVAIQDVEYIVIGIHGVSFVLHQIRHMIGAALAVAHGHSQVDLIQIGLSSPFEVDVAPLAPGCGLLLDEIRWFHPAGEDEVVFSQTTHDAARLLKEETIYPHIHSLYQKDQVLESFLEQTKERYFMDGAAETARAHDRLRAVFADWQEQRIRSAELRRARMGEDDDDDDDSKAQDDGTGQNDSNDDFQNDSQSDGQKEGQDGTRDAGSKGRSRSGDVGRRRTGSVQSGVHAHTLRSRLLPGGLFVKICVERGLLPSPEAQRLLEHLRSAVEAGEIESGRHHSYYLDVLDEKFGKPRPRSVDTELQVEVIGKS